MSYRCGICNEVCPKGQARLVHVIERVAQNSNHYQDKGSKMTVAPRKDRMEIAKEVPVCRGCKKSLEMHTFSELLDWYRKTEQLEKKSLLPPTSHPPKNGDAPAKPKPEETPKKPVTKPGRPAKPATKPKAAQCEICGRSAEGGLISSHATLCRKHMR